jgi:hypothetical protein
MSVAGCKRRAVFVGFTTFPCDVIVCMQHMFINNFYLNFSFGMDVAKLEAGLIEARIKGGME